MDAAPELSLSARRVARRERVRLLAKQQDGVLSRSQLYAAGISRGEVRANVRAERWIRLGRHCVRMTTGTMTRHASWWAAVLEAGPRAFIDGETALLAAGLEHFESTQVRVSVPRGARIRHRGTGTVNIRQTRRWHPDDVIGTGLPRARPQVAAIRAALWARSDRQATLLLTMCVQQRIAEVAGLAEQLLRIRRDRRRVLIQEVLLELIGGVSSLGELDVVRGCRERGIPEPDLQVVRRTSSGTYYLDFRWAQWGVVLEVDGIQHAWVQQIVSDALRQNDVMLTGDKVLRLPLLGLRLCPDAFFAQLARALVLAGCPLDYQRSD